MGRFKDEAYALGGTGYTEDARMRDIEAALTAAYNQGWNEGVEAAAESCADIGRSVSADVRRWGYLSRVTSTHVGEFFARATKSIRRLKKGQGV